MLHSQHLDPSTDTRLQVQVDHGLVVVPIGLDLDAPDGLDGVSLAMKRQAHQALLVAALRMQAAIRRELVAIDARDAIELGAAPGPTP